jgi:hypothetical protein
MANPSANTTATIVVPFPAGTVIHYMGNASTIQNLFNQGWLQCDGSAVSSATYPALYAAIGTTYGGNGSPNFNLPNLSGLFLRCIDPHGIEDPDCGARSSPIINDPTTVGAVVGSRQGSCVENHQHNWSRNFGQISASGGDLNIQLCNGGDKDPNQGTQATTDFDGGRAETRPRNAYAYFLMFAGLPQAGQ